MAATRWTENLNELMSFIADSTSGLWHEVSLSPIVTKVQEPAPEETAREEDLATRVPDILAILPLRGLVVYPQTVVPLTVGQPRSIKLVDDAAVGERIIGLVTSKDPENATPGPGDLYPMGTAAIVHRLFRAPDGTIRIVVQGLSRFRLGEFAEQEPYLRAHVTPAPETVEQGLEIEAMARNVRDQFAQIAELVPSVPRELVATVTSLDELKELLTRAGALA